MNLPRRILCAAGGALYVASAGATNTPANRVEARSADILAVGVVQDDRLVIHLSRLADNAPVRDATLSVLLRGAMHATRTEADGSYTLQSSDLRLPGTAALEFRVARDDVTEDLKGELAIAGEAKAQDRNNARQLWWWVLNFAVCIGFLRLWSQRRKAAAEREAGRDA